MATIKQIALLAGVSRGTVDRVLNNRGHVRKGTAEKVRAIAESLNYRPNKLGKALVSRKKQYQIAFIVFGGDNPFFTDVLAGVKEKLEEFADLGIKVQVLCTPIGDHEAQVGLLRQLEKQQISGIAITPINHPGVSKMISRLMRNGIPVVTVNTDIENSGRFAYVGSDYYRGGKTAGGLAGLISGGRANIGIVTGSHKVLCHTQRVAGFIENCAGRYPNLKIVAQCENLDDDLLSYERTREMLHSHPEIDMIFMAAAGVYGAARALEAEGMAGKVRIVCFDLTPITLELLKKGDVAATIGQHPKLQGTKPLDILSDYLLHGVCPENENFFCECDIRIHENVT
jgi:LacI family transcriptional regulator